MMKNIPLALVQRASAPTVAENLAIQLEAARTAAKGGAKLICLQELATTRYFCLTEDYAHFDLAEPIPGPTTAAFQALARETETVIVVPLFERRAPGIYHNAAVVIDADGSVAGVYRKMHIPDDPGFQEKFYFTPGDLGFRAFDTRVGRIGVLICWDQWFPEAARLTALAGAEILLYPTAIGWKPGEPEEAAAYHHSWKASMVGHAVANGVYVAAANRVGQEGEIRFWGKSFLADPSGQTVAEADDSESILYADWDRSLSEDTRRHWPFLRDRRIDAYDGLTKRYLDGE